ncbi:hypothetical protein ES705_43294 [subsurface metagenome]
MLLSKRNFKTLYGAADLTLTAKAGQSLIIRDVKIYEPSVVYANFLIERASVGFFRVAGELGNHLHFHPGRSEHSHDITSGSTAVAVMADGALRENAGGTELANSRLAETAIDTILIRAMNYTRDSDSEQTTILKYLAELGIFKGFPVGEGETFTVDLITAATAWKMIEYDLYEAGDIVNTQENGSMSSSFMFLNYGDCGASIQAVADNTLGQSNNPPEYPDFPFGAIVPSGHKIEIFGILASDIAPAANDGTDFSYTDYLKLMRGREVLFDEDHNGLLYCAQFILSTANSNMIAEGYAVGGNYTQCDRAQPLMFDPPLVFNEGEELTVSWHLQIGVGGQAITQALHEVAMICRMSPI